MLIHGFVDTLSTKMISSAADVPNAAGIKKNCVLLGSLIMQLISYRERSSTPAAAMLFSKSTICSVKEHNEKRLSFESS